MAQEIIFVSLAVAFTLFVLVYIIMSVVPITPFIYSNSRIQAKANLLIPNQKIKALTEAKSLRELASKLKDTGYIDDLNNTDIDNLKSFHKAIERNFFRSLKELNSLSPKVMRPLFESYMAFFEVKILKAIFRAKFSNTGIAEGTIYPIGRLDNIMLKRLVDTKTVADMAVILEPTPYNELFKESYSSTEEFEVAVENLAFDMFLKSAKSKMHDAKCIRDMIKKKCDIFNILALIKMKVRKVDKARQKSLVVDTHSALSKKYDLLINAEKLEDFIRICKGLPYHDTLKEAYEKYKKDSMLVHFEHGLYRFFKNYVEDNELSHMLGPYPLFSYMIKKKNENKNLFIISKGIDSRLSPKKIQEMII
ncbi:V-type ATPase subunit [Candidatus Woesearchaeota archaeon]|nr:V-type ATPase subunit [Candidatus Woesearchaeota archaeon]